MNTPPDDKVVHLKTGYRPTNNRQPALSDEMSQIRSLLMELGEEVTAVSKYLRLLVREMRRAADRDRKKQARD